MIDLRCPTCDKVLGRGVDGVDASLLRLWCKRCKMAVTPTASRQSQGSEQEE